MNWYCPNCGLQETTKFLPNRYHVCPKLRGLTAPMIPGGTKAKVEVNEREDYVANEIIFTDQHGRPVMNITTTREDGNDVLVFAPTSIARS